MIRWGIVSLCTLAFSPSAFAQCNQRVNPHSFDCANDTFVGLVFPVANLTQEFLTGRWTLLTYSAVGDRPGPEFAVKVNPQNPRVPEGVVNRADGTMAGPFDFDPGRLRMHDFFRHGAALNEVAGTGRFLDFNTFQVFLKGAAGSEGFQCRVFLRNRNDHLLCRWFSVRNGKSTLRGFLGYLRANSDLLQAGP